MSTVLNQGKIEARSEWDVVRQAVGEIPEAARDLAREAWENPGRAARHTFNVVSTAAVMGVAFSYLVPAGGPAGLIIGTALTAPLAVHGYGRLREAQRQSMMEGADLERIAERLARDTVAGSTDFGLTFLAGGFAASAGHRLAGAGSRLSVAAEMSQGALLKAENEGMVAAVRLGRAFIADSAVSKAGTLNLAASAETAGIKQAAAFEPQYLTGLKRQVGIVNQRLDQYLGTPENRSLYFGSLHGHSRLSDGKGAPAELYAKAKADGAHFTAITDHNHLAARDGIKPGDPRIPDQSGVPVIAEAPIGYAQTFADAAAATENGKFVALVGVEMGTIGKVGGHHGGNNHLNLFEVPTFFEAVREPRSRFDLFFKPFRRMLGMKEQPEVVPPDVIQYNNGDIKSMITHLDKLVDTTGKRPIIQLNHPRYLADHNPALEAAVRGRDYGVKSFRSEAEWRERFGKYASQIEVIKGEALNPNPIDRVKTGDLDPVSFAGYIDKGLHLSPTFGRDFHFGEPVANPAGTGIYARALTKDGLLSAMRERRTIATTDTRKLHAVMDTAEGHAMGSILDRAAVPELTFKAKIGGEIRPDARYKVVLWGDRTVGDGELAKPVQTLELVGRDLLNGDGIVAFNKIKMPLTKKTAHYMEIQRQEPGVEHIDRMWTAPIWVQPLSSTRHSFWWRGLVSNGNQLVPGVSSS